jgi:UDP-N-acetyl-D-glucosamine/UDP-N-acetyl-D-galactosamine dehydrogenase
VLVLGLTFKENVPDFRNSKIADTIKELKSFGTEIYGHDPYAHHLTQHILDELNLKQSEIVTEIQEGYYDAVIYATTHNEYVTYDFDTLLNENGVIYDIK